MPDRTAMLQALAASPVLALEPRYLGHMLAVIEGRQAAKPVRSPLVMGRPVQGTTIIEGVGIVPVMGPMLRHADPFAEFFGAVSIDSIRTSLRALHDSPDVDAIINIVDSPGGDVEGCTDLAAELFAMRGSKPILTLGDGGIYSAAYWVFCNADRVALPVDGGAGSIGVLAIHVDLSEMLERSGQKIRVFKSGEKKDAFSPFGPLSEDAAREIQADVDAHAARFHKAVAKARGLDVATVKGFEAGIFAAPAAVTAGLADQITTLDAAFLALRKSASTPGRGRAAAQKEPTMPDPETPAAAGNVIPISEAHRMRDEAKEAGAREASERFATITAMCTKAEFPELAAGMVARKLTLEQATAELDTCAGIRDAAFAGQLTDEQTRSLIGQVATGLTLKEANAKVVAIMKQASGPEIDGRHVPGQRARTAQPALSVREVYQGRREAVEKARAANPLLAGVAR